MREKETVIEPTGHVFEELWPATAPRVRAYAMMSIGSYHDAEDVVQETALAIAGSMHKYDPERPFLQWALGFARIRVLKHLKSKGRDRKMVYNSTNLNDIEAAFVELDQSQRGWEEQLKFCVERLPTKSRRLFDLRYLNDLSASEIAAATDMTVESVYTRLSQIRLALRNCIVRRLKAEEKL